MQQLLSDENKSMLSLALVKGIAVQSFKLLKRLEPLERLELS